MDWEDCREREVQGVGTEGFRPWARDIASENEFRVLLTSACIIRDPGTGQIDPCRLVEEITQKLSNRAKLIRKRWTFDTVGGFNRKWSMETPQVLAVAAGSVLVFKAGQKIPLTDLYRMEHEGLGERREEGHGRVLFLEGPLRTVCLHRPEKPKPDPSVTGTPPELVSLIEKRLLAAQLGKKIDEAAARIADSATSLPTNSLIGRLRTVLRGDPQTGIHTLGLWLKGSTDAERLRRSAMEQLEHCRIVVNGRRSRLSDWIMEAARKENQVARLQLEALSQRSHVISEDSAGRILEERDKDIAVRLIDGVLKALALRNKLTLQAGTATTKHENKTAQG